MLPAVGAAGCVVIDTLVVDGYDGHPFDEVIVVHVYVPAAAAVTFVMVGFCRVLVYPFGPVHE